MRLQDIAELLVASWVLSSEQNPEPLPTSHSILDRALQTALGEGAFPSDWRTRLHFVDSRIGLQCVELSSVIRVAQRAEFTEEPNPSYSTTRIKINPTTARQLLHRRALDEETAKRWGAILHEAVDKTKATLNEFSARTA